MQPAAFVIEKGVPFPKLDGRHGRSGPRTPIRWPWGRLKIGDSVLVLSEAARVSACRWAARHRAKIVTRKTIKGIRIWRLA